jgi:hypothetical protein
MLPLAIIFSVLFLAMTLLLAIVSVHGPESLSTFALIYLGVSNAVWWWSFVQFKRRGFKTRYFALEGVALLAMGVAFGASAHLYSEFRDKYRLENTKVTDVSDEPLVNESGQPIGIRFQFTLEFPTRDYYYIEPYLQPDPEYKSKIWQQIPLRTFNPTPLNMRVIAKSLDPFPSGEDFDAFSKYQGNIPAIGLRFDKGVAYRFRFDMTPSYLRKDKAGNYCIAYPNEQNRTWQREAFDAIIQLEPPARYEVRISGAPYGNWRWEGPAQYTDREYSPKIFYDAIMAMNPAACDPNEYVVY